MLGLTAPHEAHGFGLGLGRREGRRFRNSGAQLTYEVMGLSALP